MTSTSASKKKVSVLIMVDIQNAFFGALNFTDRKYGVDYEKLYSFLLNFIEDSVDDGVEIEVHPYAYGIKTRKHQGVGLFAALKRVGYFLDIRECLPKEETKTRGSVATKMQLDLLEKASLYDIVIVVSGSGVFEPALRSIKRDWDTYCCLAAFDNTLHKVYREKPELVDHLILLGEDVIKWDAERN